MDYLYSPTVKNKVVQMLPFYTLIGLNKDLSTPVYQQIANRIIQLIRDGIIKPGTFIPSSRVMAEMLSVHRKTVVAAYEDLASQDWIETIPRKGIIVSKNLPELKPRSFKAVSGAPAFSAKPAFSYHKIKPLVAPAIKKKSYRFVINDGFPDPRIAPIDTLFRQYRYFFQRPSSDGSIMHGDKAGSMNLRMAISRFISDTRGMNTEASNLLLTRGAQMAIFIAARMLLKPGARVIVGDPSYSMANNIFEQFGAKLIKVPVDNEGINVDEIERLCIKQKPDMLYIIPHHHHPTTVTLSAGRRMKLLSLIREYRLPVIEDDYDYDFHYTRSPILPLASADHGGYVIYISSITKCFASSIRMGYLVSSEEFVNQAAQLREMIDIRGDVLLEESLAILFNNGDMQKHLKKSVKIYQQRRDLFCDLLQKEFAGKLSFAKPSGGMSVWVKFDKKYNLKEISQQAGVQGLYIADGTSYNTGKAKHNALRMGFASLNEKEMQGVIGILKKLL
jgi:GntR family transcriptional regulator/MocR family aminotransferase